MPDWKLTNADELAAASKYTFFKPSRETIAKVKPGEHVKLIFAVESDDPNAPSAERMWVIVDTVEADGRFTGRLVNEPGWIKDLKLGATLEFDASHIITTDHDHEDTNDIVERYSVRCLVSNRILRDKAPVGALYREAPLAPEDSGWRFLANDETQEYVDDPDNYAYVSVGAVLRQDDSFIDLLESPAGACFERDPETGKFVPGAFESEAEPPSPAPSLH